MARILIVDDELHMRRILSALLQEDSHTVAEASGTKQAISQLKSSPFDLLITDQKMQDGDGLMVLATAKEADPNMPVVMLTAFATVELAVEAMKQGAFDFIAKPFVPEVVRSVVRRASERAELVRENERLKGEVKRLTLDEEILGDSAAIQEVKAKIARVAPTDATALIIGETGTGKELVARAIHKGSRRANQSFIAVNCAAFPESLLESELFGHERGAFTGADRLRQGLFEAAHRGTLFLDEAGEMSLPLQAKLLRVLTDGQVLRLGATTPRKVDVRIIVATHRDLQQRVREGLFREDLYYRLAVVPVEIPALRQRSEDIPGLIEHLLKQIGRDLKIPRRTITRAAIEKLVHYEFPGNIRELRNLIERACILAKGPELGPGDFFINTAGSAGLSERAKEPPQDHLHLWIESLPTSFDLHGVVESVERELIAQALRQSNGVQAEAARMLGISRSDLGYKIKKYNVADR